MTNQLRPAAEHESPAIERNLTFPCLRRRLDFHLFLVVSLFSISVMGCGNSSTSKPGLEKVRLQLNWFPDAQHGGFYSALINGHYAAEGLDVEIVPGGPGAAVEAKVDRGQVEFGVANAHRILLKRKEGARIRAVFAAFQQSPRCIMVHRESGIQSFDDLNGVKLAVGSDAAFRKYMESKVDLSRVTPVTYFGSNTKFLSNQSYAQQAYSFSEPILVKQKGADPVVLMLSDLGFNPYTSCLFANDDLILNSPSRIRKFVKATQKGWRDYLQNPEPANIEMDRLNKEHDLEALNAGAAAAKPLCQTPDVVPLGWMDESRWETLHQQLVELEMLEVSDDPRGAFTTEFIPRPQ